MQNVLILETNKYAIKLQNFEGPLDLLCHLIDKNKMNICDIKISEITDQYIEYLNKMEQMNLEITSEFLIMASTLLYLKSKSLLPSIEEDEKGLSEEELIRRIIEYKKYKEITKKLKEAFLVNSKRLFKKPEEIELPKQKIQKDIIPKIYQRLNKNGWKPPDSQPSTYRHQYKPNPPASQIAILRQKASTAVHFSARRSHASYDIRQEAPLRQTYLPAPGDTWFRR